MTELRQIESTLALFAEGISGRRFRVLDESNLTAPYTDSFNQAPLSDTLNLYLPEEFSFFESPAQNAAAYRLLALQQLAYREFGTYSFDVSIARSKISRLAAREAPSAYRETELELFYKHFEHPRLAEALFQLIESVRVERMMLRTYLGAQKYRRSLQQYYDANFSFSEDPLINELVNLSGTLRQVSFATSNLAGAVEAELKQHPSVYGSAAATVHCYDACVDLVGENVVPTDFADGMELDPSLKTIQRETRLEKWEEELDKFNADLASLSFAETAGERVLGTDGDVDGEIRELGVEIEQQRDQQQRKINMERASLGISAAESADEGFAYRYDEWDYLNARWLKDWCRLRELLIPHTANDNVSELLEHIQPLVHAVRKQFEQIKPTGMRRVKHVIDGDELDLTSLVEARIDLISGHSPDERIYSRKESTHRDVSAVVLVDLSASTDASIEEDTDQEARNEPSKPQDLRDPYFDDDYLNGNLDFKKLRSLRDARRRVIDIQRESVLLLASALEPLGDSYAVYGFSGYGKDNVELYVAKDFEETLSHATINAIAAMEPKRSTRMGPAIRHSTAKLAAQGQSMKVLIIVSDGFPQDCDYGPDRSDHEYGVQDTAMALREAQLKGIQTFCVTVDQAGHDYLRKMCSDDRYLIIEDVEQLPIALNRVYNLLTSF